MLKNKVLVTGYIVGLLSALLPVLLDALGYAGLGLDFAWLGDGDITLYEVINLLAWLLTGTTTPVRETIKATLLTEETY